MARGLRTINTANYAEEDVVVLIKEACKDFYLPPMEKIKGNPTIYFFLDSILPSMFTLHFTGGDYFSIDSSLMPDGKVFAIPIQFNNPETAVGQRLFAVKPIIDGVWFAYTYSPREETL